MVFDNDLTVPLVGKRSASRRSCRNSGSPVEAPMPIPLNRIAESQRLLAGSKRVVAVPLMTAQAGLSLADARCGRALCRGTTTEPPGHAAFVAGPAEPAVSTATAAGTSAVRVVCRQPRSRFGEVRPVDVVRERVDNGVHQRVRFIPAPDQ
jgi:hypothetical protein